MKVVLSQRVDYITGRNETRDSVDRRLAEFIQKSEALVFPIPNIYEDSKNLSHWLDAIKAKAFVLSGGSDLGVRPERDKLEFQLLTYAFDNEIPVLGICRGMQIMGTWAGSHLKQVSGHVGIRHRLTGDITREVNSYHNLALEEAPSEFEILANSEDGEIEAIRHKKLRWEGWMWHPERENEFSVEDINRFKMLIK